MKVLHRMTIGLLALVLVLSTIAIRTPEAAQAAAIIQVDTVAEIQVALQQAVPGDIILVAPGTYELTTASTVGIRPAYYYSGANGTAAEPITLQSANPAIPAILKGGAISSPGYTLYLTGDYWNVNNITVTHGQKGIVLDNANHVHLNGVTVRHVGQEGIHIRDGSSYAIIENSIVDETGATGNAADKGFAEGIYIGSDRSVWDVNEGLPGSSVGPGQGYDRAVLHTIVRNNVIGPAVAAEMLDIKEGTSHTLIEDNLFLGAGIAGVGFNFADSYIDVKGVNVTIRNNIGYRQNNTGITADIAEVNRTSSSPWCPANETSNQSLGDTSDGNTYTSNQFFAGHPPVAWDRQAPSVPGGLTATAASSSAISLTWSASSDNVGVAGYRIYRNGVQFATTNTTSYTDTGLSSSTSYTYTVQAYDAFNNVSASSVPSSATTLSSGGGGGTSSLKIQYEDGDGAAGNNAIKPFLKIVNTGATAIPLSELTVRYYFKREAAVAQNLTIDYAVIGKTHITGSFYTMGSPTATADAYLELGFLAAAGSVAALGDTGVIKVRINNSNWSNFNEANDYSYAPSMTSFADHDKITLYHNGNLVWGTQP
ncbi:cellulose binding domain-containing protein [Paenibacillus sp. 1011MAR3C5]|uniref:cellulose binding domain-containing protein n=1 Tax=Paenibacillus sp. 1011MAR3C5 TaxID=1675787 RepID=UPI001603BE00|nr:cellulose binding domain-containing protein [Paenibacillus sp. 1011MAR3C5]